MASITSVLHSCMVPGSKLMFETCLSQSGKWLLIEGGGGNSYTGQGIHVPAPVMGQFAVFCPGYGSCFVNFALDMGLLYGD